MGEFLISVAGKYQPLQCCKLLSSFLWLVVWRSSISNRLLYYTVLAVEMGISMNFDLDPLVSCCLGRWYYAAVGAVNVQWCKVMVAFGATPPSTAHAAGDTYSVNLWLSFVFHVSLSLSFLPCHVWSMCSSSSSSVLLSILLPLYGNVNKPASYSVCSATNSRDLLASRHARRMYHVFHTLHDK